MSKHRLILLLSFLPFIAIGLSNCNPPEPGTDPVSELCDELKSKYGEEGLRDILENCMLPDSAIEFVNLTQRNSDKRAVATFNLPSGIEMYWAARLGDGPEFDTIVAYFNNSQEDLVAMGFAPHEIQPANRCEPMSSVYQELYLVSPNKHSDNTLEAQFLVTIDGKPKKRGTLVTQFPLSILDTDDGPEPGPDPIIGSDGSEGE